MSRLVYLDCVGGASGDMLLGALIDAGAPAAPLEAALRRLPLGDWQWSVTEVERNGLRSRRVQIEGGDEGPPRRLPDLLALLEAGELPVSVRERAGAVFRRLGEAEARAHGERLEQATFHEVGQADTVLDVVGTLLALAALEVEAVFCSPLPLASAGETVGGHGRLPLPAPATLEILSAVGAPTRPAPPGVAGELVTPTGAALVAELARFERPALRLERVGLGAGKRDPSGWPNVLRAWLGEGEAGAAAGEVAVRPVVVLETVLDDMTAEQVGFARERLLAAGALDVWLQPIGMKKGRSGLQLTAVARPQREAAVARALLRETSTLGVRVREERRYEAAREQRTVATSLGEATVTLKRLPGERPRIAPEFDDCARLAAERGLPIAEVYALVAREAEALVAREAGAQLEAEDGAARRDP